MGADGIVLNANPAELELLGYDLDQYVGRHIAEFHVEAGRVEEMLARLLHGETIEKEPCRLRCRDGSIREVLVNAHGRWESGALVDVRCITIDITDLRRTELALRASEERYRALVEGHAEMLCRFRPDGTILFANAAYARALDTTPEALTRANFWDFVPREDQPAVRAMLGGLTPEAPESRVENRFRTKDGERWVLWTNRALTFDGAGRLLEAQSTGIDMTRRKQVEQALQESDRRKDEFLATLAHELRNPLAPISNSLAILRQSADPVRQRRAQDAIDRQLSHLVRLVDDLLDVSRITRDKLELRRSRVELAPVLHQALESCRSMAGSEHLALELALPDQPVFLDADPVRLAQVLNNLLNNACKYTPPGGSVGVRVTCSNGQAAIAVKDTGIGVPSDKLDGIFEMFAQVQSPGQQSSGGLGIGLTLVKRLVELHGGRVEAHSDGPGTGSEFTVRLPLAARRLVGEGQAASQAAGPPTARRILIVDDNRDSADSLGTLLELEGHDTRVVYEGVSALDEGARFTPDVVLLDLGLPEMSGIEVCRRMRTEAWGRDIRIVALTGWGQEQDRRRSRDAGFDEHVVKPVEHRVLARLLENI